MTGRHVAAVCHTRIAQEQHTVARRTPASRNRADARAGGAGATAREGRLAAALALIERDFRTRGLKLAHIARAAHLSEFHFHRLFRSRYGTTTKQLVGALRVAEVQRLVMGGSSLCDAARAAGFAHQSHMTARFKQIVGMTPRQWALKTREGDLA